MVAELVVVSWNIQGRDPASIDLPEAVRGWGADVLLLQEVRGQRLRDALPEYPTCLTWPLGIAIVSRFTHEEAGTAQGGVAQGQRPRLGWARLALDDGPITVATVHLMSPPWPGTLGRRRTQRAAVAAWAGERAAAGERVIVGGDFNTIDPSLNGLTALSARSGRTWRPLAVPWMPPIFRIDAVFGAGQLQPVSGRTDGRWRGSDHCPVVVRIGLQGLC
ncbi:MAG TPA: endonuclease/exonuclease/phosphatase family protein [Candidatus Limnocylindria bacterium]|nr:endonuclease/exonuclease/phosphatase family protein [Candidatus Limnocylindria bacterium]